MLIKQQTRGSLEVNESTEIILTKSDLPHTKLEDFNLLLVLGKGSFGKVCRICGYWLYVWCLLCMLWLSVSTITHSLLWIVGQLLYFE